MACWVLFILFVWPAAVKANPPEHVITVQAEESIFYKGRKNTVVIWVTVKPGYHIQADRVDDESLIPTTLEIDSTSQITASKIKFPRPHKFKLEGTDTYLSVFDGKFPIRLSLASGPEAKTGKWQLNATIQYQACDSRTCLFPRVIEFSIPVDVREKDGSSE